MKKKCAVLFSGGKDSTFAALLAKEKGYDLTCLITVVSENPESYMFHTPSIKSVFEQARVMKIPLIIVNTFGKKEKELKDLEKGIKKAIKEYKIEGVITGAVESVYQASRVQKICNKLNIECFNPLWQRNQGELLAELVKRNFEIILTGVFAYPFDKEWLGRKIDKAFIRDIKGLVDKYQINPAGEGGEFESLVLNCDLFKQRLNIVNFKDTGNKNSWRREVELK